MPSTSTAPHDARVLPRQGRSVAGGELDPGAFQIWCPKSHAQMNTVQLTFGTEKDKKNAKEHGGSIAAAVTHQAAGKLSNGGGSDNSSSNNLPVKSGPNSHESTPPINTPDTKATVLDNVQAAPSPLLDAISNVSVSASTAPSMTNEWARSGAFAGSPGNLINFMGDSPPTMPSSYEDAPGRAQPGWPDQRAFVSSSPASPSPPHTFRRPMSYNVEQNYQPPGSMPRASPGALRRSSLQSQLSQPRFSAMAAPKPHQQAHLYGASDLDLTITPRSGIKASERGYYFGFDRWPDVAANGKPSPHVVLAGYEGGLDVYAVNKKGLDCLGGLKGLHGGVVHAKILPWSTADGTGDVYPLIAVVVHGPVLPTALNHDDKSEVAPGAQRKNEVDSYRTTVQVYSLKTSKLVETLMTLPLVPINTAIALTSPAFQPPAPTGSLTIKAEAGNIAICSGTSGECWIYSQLSADQNRHLFACVGKVWTTLQHGPRVDIPKENEQQASSTKSARSSAPAPVFALNGRWLAYCPATSDSSPPALQAHVTVPILGRAAGLKDLLAPHVPLITASVDLISDSFVNKLMRDTTQELISGANFLSFSPSSMALFTASSKGDVQNVWDLLRIQHTKYSSLQSTISPEEGNGPLIRQIAHFSRMTVARVVDVAWAEPHGERLAMVTERGTVHLLEMPFSAHMWPPPRRRVPNVEKDAGTKEANNSAVSMATGAFGAAYSAAMPFVARSRRGSVATPPVGAINPTSTFRDTAAHGGRVIAAGITHSLGKTGTAINHFRHAGENRVAVPPSSISPAAACVEWMRGRKSHSLFALGDGLVRTFPSKQKRMSTHRGAGSSRIQDFKVPLLPDDIIAPAVRQILESGTEEEVLDMTDRDMEAGNNTLTLNQARQKASICPGPAFYIPQAEIESSAPYQPFHTDRRVTVCELISLPHGGIDEQTLVNGLEATSLEAKPSKKKPRQQHQQVVEPNGAWAFGQDIPATNLHIGPRLALDDDGESGDLALPPSAMERTLQYGDHEQIVVTTRKRRGPRNGDQDGDGFFEDDCEVLDFADQRV
ncbi:uncharacterized protein J7T54_001744 [Emericellopsis cladophorae]|uniref:BCAS3 domain-containing protein n=1 Tax=Emericellopsis cladophorae TaxID=2686198 RepID=A0A9P9Y5C0_9HYPO|nr:uncharacterized protein J7T54_001744 [Emericellopsis cladophorae]KAI6783868.1 hypothetical protein J7T54_001744 [Emericellopsis cladophorae]